MRYATTGFFAVYIDPDVSVSARLPPMPILDLNVLTTTVDQVTIDFTAPGEDLDFGRGECRHSGVDNKNYLCFDTFYYQLLLVVSV